MTIETLVTNPMEAVVIRAVCCLAAADGRISGQELNTLYKAIRGLGYSCSPAAFKDAVKATCITIHKKGALAAADGLLASIATLQGGSLALLLMQLVGKWMHDDRPMTAEEQAIVLKFEQALTSTNPRADDASSRDQALAIVNSARPPFVDVATVTVPEHADDAVDEAGIQHGTGLSAALKLVGHSEKGFLDRVQVARQILEFIRGSKASGGAREACRCTACGRRYWFDFGSGVVSVICPFCGAYQRAYRDWRAAPQPVVRTSTYVRPASTPTYRGGPIHVKGYRSKTGKWVQSHSRARPRRRKW